jgi:hypothetical protein
MAFTREQADAVRDGATCVVAGKVTDILEEPNTGLFVLDFGDWSASVPIHAVVVPDPEGDLAKVSAERDELAEELRYLAMLLDAKASSFAMDAEHARELLARIEARKTRGKGLP